MNPPPQQSITLQHLIPNILTGLRLIATPAVVILIMENAYSWAVALFFLAGITDFIDGYLARLWQVESTFGRIFDPIADKSMMVGSMIALGYVGLLPLWIIYLIIGRDILIVVAGLIIHFLKLPIHLAPILSSKINTFFQMFLVGTALVNGATTHDFTPHPVINFILFATLWITAFTTLWSGVEYTIYFIRENFDRNVKE